VVEVDALLLLLLLLPLLPLSSTITEDSLELVLMLELELCWGQPPIIEVAAVFDPNVELKLSLAVDLLSRLLVYFLLLVGVVDRSLYVH